MTLPRRMTTIGAALLALLAGAAPAAIASPVGNVITQVSAPTQVAARDGVLVWGQLEPGLHWFRLMQRTATGVIQPVGVLPIIAHDVDTQNGSGKSETETFQVTLGQDAEGRLTAAYPRCLTPSRATCKLALATLSTGAEQIVDGTEGALRGAISGSRVVWVVGTAGGPDRLFARHQRNSRPARLRLPPTSTPAARGPVAAASLRISAVDVRQRDIAYVLDFQFAQGPIAESQVWLDRSGARLNRVARVGTGGASSGFRQFLQPRLLQNSLVTYMQGRDQTNAVVRYSFAGRVLGSGSIGVRGRGIEPEVTGGQFDRGRFVFSTAPYQGIGCADFEGNPPGATCPILDSGSLTLAAPLPRRR